MYSILPIIVLIVGLILVVCWGEYLHYKYCKLMGHKYNFFRWDD